MSGGSDGKESACKEEDLGSIPGSRRSPGKGIRYPLQCFLPGEFHGQVWQVHGAAKSQTRLSDSFAFGKECTKCGTRIKEYNLKLKTKAG